jgi:formate hydrogenlyase subunit 6/NADH:ubiquinone oxidoreductase subunit I
VESCPVSALSPVGRVPAFNYRLCINCLCCQEICPEHAISQKKSLLAGLLR